ncbi:MAG: orotidine-5'-phosphate decarboxylase [Defluviitaleaceae bacterium]|nr:orotidine-5'-phosphate decarboxylase [Defluviitaleaceae bacterium]
MKKEVIIACDFPSKKELYAFLEPFEKEGLKPFLKIGMELFYREGPSIIEELKVKGAKIFLDLKLHDIPNTVGNAMKNIGRLGVDITNLHAAGGISMMKAARIGLDEGAMAVGAKSPILLAITQLTSIDEEALKTELLISSPLKNTVIHYAKNAKEAGCDGVVCSALEVSEMNKLGLVGLTPGIRLEGDDTNDQKRLATPTFAKEAGSTYIVVGRSITHAKDSVVAYKKCVFDFET